MATTISFRWLDILEKEFDKAFVDLDILIGEVDNDEPDLVYNARQKISTLSSCFAQLTHKAQTIFQNSAKVEAELVHLRAELIDAQSRHSTLEQELHNVLLRLHSQQLQQLSVQDANSQHIRQRLEGELQRSPLHQPAASGENAEALLTEVWLLRQENSTLRNTLLALHSEVSGAKLAAKYLDKELAGRIQQLQLLGREMRGDIRDKLWRQLESEILLHRHKTIVRACRSRGPVDHSHNMIQAISQSQAAIVAQALDTTKGLSEPRLITLQLSDGEGLGLSITGGRENGVPILISELEPNGPAARSGALYVGDAILSVNGQDLKAACHQEAVQLLSCQSGDIALKVQYVASEDSDDESLGQDIYAYRYRFFDDEVLGSNEGVPLHPCNEAQRNLSTPTAPRTPESSHPITRTTSDCSFPDSPLNTAGPIPNHNSLSQSEANISQYSEANYSNSIALSSPMQTSTDDNAEQLLSNSEESLVRSPVEWRSKAARRTNNYYYGPENSPKKSANDIERVTVPLLDSDKFDDSSNVSTPAKMSCNINNMGYEGVEEGKNGRRFVISTLQQIFGVGRTENSRTSSKDSQEVEALLENEAKVDSDVDASPLKHELDEITSLNTSDEVINVEISNFESELKSENDTVLIDLKGDEDVKQVKVDIKNNELKEAVRIESPKEKRKVVKYTKSDAFLPTKARRKISVKGTQFAVKLSEKRSGRAQRMKDDDSSTNSSLDDDAKDRLRESIAKNSLTFPSTKLKVLRSELNSEVGGPNFVSNYKDRLRDSLGDPDFGTPV